MKLIVDLGRYRRENKNFLIRQLCFPIHENVTILKIFLRNYQIDLELSLLIYCYDVLNLLVLNLSK